MSSLLTSLLFLAAAGLGTSKECDQTTSTDSEGFGCEKFVLHPWQCVDRTYDDDDFTALDACCACEDSSPARDLIRQLSATEPTAATTPLPTETTLAAGSFITTAATTPLPNETTLAPLSTTLPTAAPTPSPVPKARIGGASYIEFLTDALCPDFLADLKDNGGAEAICNTTKDMLAATMAAPVADAMRNSLVCELGGCDGRRLLSRRLSSSVTLENDYVFEVSQDDQAAASASADEALGPNATDDDMVAFQTALSDALAATGMTINVTAVERSETHTVTIVIVTTTPEDNDDTTMPLTPSTTPSATTTATPDTPSPAPTPPTEDGAFEARSNIACGAVLALLIHIVY